MKSFSQKKTKQDLWVLKALGNKRGGYFVEAGAADGKTLSNTFLLENTFGWEGICVEPGPKTFSKLKALRKCHCLNLCLWSSDDQDLRYVVDPLLGGVDSHLSAKHRKELHSKNAPKIPCKSATLGKILRDLQAPRMVDYLSLDTEGSELEILGAFDFNEYGFRVATIEHQADPAIRTELVRLMTGNGYRHVGDRAWEGFFVNQRDPSLAKVSL